MKRILPILFYLVIITTPVLALWKLNPFTAELDYYETGTGAPTDADYLVGTTNASLSAEIVVGTTPGGSLGGTWASPTIDDLFLLNSASDTMIGTLTADGFTLGNDELITFGVDTLKFDGTTDNDFELSDDLTIEDTDPHIKLTDTTTNEDDFEMYADGNQWYLTNVTDAKEFMNIGEDNLIEFYNQVGFKFPDGAPSDNQILKYDVALGRLAWEADVGGSASPGGASGDVQYNDGASGFAAEAAFNYIAATNALTVGGVITSDGFTLGADELITFGTKTLKYETTRADFILGDDLIVEDTHPGMYIQDRKSTRLNSSH